MNKPAVKVSVPAGNGARGEPATARRWFMKQPAGTGLSIGSQSDADSRKERRTDAAGPASPVDSEEKAGQYPPRSKGATGRQTFERTTEAGGAPHRPIQLTSLEAAS